MLKYDESRTNVFVESELESSIDPTSVSASTRRIDLRVHELMERMQSLERHLATDFAADRGDLAPSEPPRYSHETGGNGL